jgi:hypothetical protein
MLGQSPWPGTLHDNENPIYVFLFWELHGLCPRFHIHLSVRDLYIPRIGPHISCSRLGRSIVGIYKSLTDTWMWKLILWPHNSFSGNICFEFSLLVLCSVWEDSLLGYRPEDNEEVLLIHILMVLRKRAHSSTKNNCS